MSLLGGKTSEEQSQYGKTYNCGYSTTSSSKIGSLVVFEGGSKPIGGCRLGEVDMVSIQNSSAFASTSVLGRGLW